MDHLRCVVERITYQNAENGFSVIKRLAKGYTDLVTAAFIKKLTFSNSSD